MAYAFNEDKSRVEVKPASEVYSKEDIDGSFLTKSSASSTYMRKDEGQEKLAFDQTPSFGSNNPVTSNGIYSENVSIRSSISALDSRTPETRPADYIISVSYMDLVTDYTGETFQGPSGTGKLVVVKYKQDQAGMKVVHLFGSLMTSIPSSGQTHYRFVGNSTGLIEDGSYVVPNFTLWNNGECKTTIGNTMTTVLNGVFELSFWIESDGYAQNADFHADVWCADLALS